MKFNYKNLVVWALVIVAIFLFAMVLGDMGNNAQSLSYGDVISFFNEERVRSVEIGDDNMLTIKVVRVDENGAVVQQPDKNGNLQTVLDTYQYQLNWSVQVEEVHALATEQYQKGIIEYFNYEEPKQTPVLYTFLPWILVLGAIIGIYILVAVRSGGAGAATKGGFARSHAKLGSAEKNLVRFSDVAGADEEKAELEEVVEFLRNPGKFVKLGARIPRGVLLVGPPGTGKTLLAKAVAGEAGVPFYSISGSDFVEMYVGVGASRVRDLFENARKNVASIIFIDEIDAVGRHRGAGLGGGHDEREQTLNQLLVEMDGFGNHEGVIVMAATNRPDILDPALLRPGRFDRQITVNYPDLKGREEILRVHVRNKPLEADVDLHKVAQATVYFTGADLANLMNEAALLAARRGKSLIGMREVDEATLKVLVGSDKKREITPDDKKLTAYHEAGHAVLAHLLPGQDPVTRISVIPTSKGAGGYTLTPPTKDRSYEFKKNMENDITVFLGGRVAEMLVFDDYTGGASSDIKQATRIARRMITVYGMSEVLGTVCLAGEHDSDEVFLGRDFSSGNNLSEETSALIDREIKRIITTAQEKAESILRANMDKLHRIAEFLIAYEVMDGEQFKALMDENATTEQLVEMARAREERSRQENEEAARRVREAEERARQAFGFTDAPAGPPDENDGEAASGTDQSGSAHANGDSDNTEPADQSGTDDSQKS